MHVVVLADSDIHDTTKIEPSGLTTPALFDTLRNSNAVIYSGLAGKYGNDRDIFALTLPGELIYIVTNPKHVREVYKNTVTLLFDTFIEDLMLSCGTSKQAAGKSSQQPPPYPEDAQMTSLNPEKKSIINLAMDFHHIQLLLRKGRKIMIPDRQLHEDPVAWGADSLDFQPNRWLKNVLSKRNACFKPFGGVIAVSSFRWGSPSQ
ncbi:hypothetical protein V2W45_1511193 [Cenococcum geophilum]